MSYSNQKSTPLIAFIGAGNMAGAIIRGLIRKGYPPEQIRASAPSLENLRALENSLRITVHQANNLAVSGADVIVLGIKPQQVKAVCEEISPNIGSDALVVSLAAGISSSSIETWLGQPCPIVRCMSNTPAQIGLGASGLFANRQTSDTQKNIAEQIIASVGLVKWVDEEHLIDTVTALAGSGPAYFFLFIEAMIDTAVEQGLSREIAQALALQTAHGATQLAANSKENIIDLRKRVTSPKGTTEHAINSFENDDLRTCVKNAMDACLKRAQELARQ